MNIIAKFCRKREHRQREERRLPRKTTSGSGDSRARGGERRRLLAVAEGERCARGRVEVTESGLCYTHGARLTYLCISVLFKINCQPIETLVSRSWLYGALPTSGV